MRRFFFSILFFWINFPLIFSQLDTTNIELPVKDTNVFYIRTLFHSSENTPNLYRQNSYYYRIVPPQYETYFDTIETKSALTCATKDKDFDIVTTAITVKDGAFVWDNLKLKDLPICYHYQNLIPNEYMILGFNYEYFEKCSVKFKIPKKELMTKGCYDFANTPIKTQREVIILKKERFLKNGDLEIRNTLNTEERANQEWQYCLSGFWSKWRIIDSNCPTEGGHTAKRIQIALNKKGYKVVVDDEMNEETKAALIQFELDYGLRVGVLTIELLRALGLKLL